jgi:probable selenium-dependent hydroxylase accessory protein YqeC
VGHAPGVTALSGLTGLAEALGIGARSHVAIVGGGGKTTTLHALADQLTGRVVATTTTKMGADQQRRLRVLIDPDDETIVAATTDGPVIAWARIDGEKAVGVPPERCDRWAALVDHVVIEADGSKHQPFKAPAWYEPVVPATTTSLVQVMGAEALGRVILDRCHRPLRVAALAGCRPGDRLTPERAAAVLLHADGALRTRPAGADTAVVITKVDDESRAIVEALVDLLVERPDLTIVTVPRLDVA